MGYILHLGGCRDVMAGMDAACVDSIVTDPPYGISFMGRDWDHGVPGEPFWRDALRVSKPGAHLLAFGGTRTFHRLAVAIEDAGWEIRDTIAWVYGSGFPKGLNVSKAIDKAAGAERKVVGRAKRPGKEREIYGVMTGNNYITTPATDAARQWDGWRTTLKPAMEPIVVARKPIEDTVATNVMKHGTGGLNIDGCRVAGAIGASYKTLGNGDVGSGGVYEGGYRGKSSTSNPHKESVRHNAQGRFPANLIHDGSEEATAGTGDAARFFYCAKASKQDRDEGCEGLEAVRGGSLNMRTDAHSQANGMDTGPRLNHHPTVKPTDLMAYLVRLVTPPGGTVLDPFCGSGSTGKAAIRGGFDFQGIDLSADYLEIARARMEYEASKETQDELRL